MSTSNKYTKDALMGKNYFSDAYINDYKHDNECVFYPQSIYTASSLVDRLCKAYSHELITSWLYDTNNKSLLESNNKSMECVFNILVTKHKNDYVLMLTVSFNDINNRRSLVVLESMYTSNQDNLSALFNEMVTTLQNNEQYLQALTLRFINARQKEKHNIKRFEKVDKYFYFDKISEMVYTNNFTRRH